MKQIKETVSNLTPVKILKAIMMVAVVFMLVSGSAVGAAGWMLALLFLNQIERLRNPAKPSDNAPDSTPWL